MSSTTSVCAVVVDQTGGPDVLQVRQIELVPPGEGQVRVRLAIAGVNYVDVYQRTGDHAVATPFVAGFEGAGVVEAIGPGVDGVTAGDRVAYARAQGSYAEASLVPAGALISLPDEMPFEQAAAFPMQAITAHYLIHAFRVPVPGDVVLVHAAAGGVGRLLVQWAHHLGAKVIGTVSTQAKAAVAEDAGADHTVLYTEQDFTDAVGQLTAGRGADIVFDGVGGATLAVSVRAAARHGHVVSFGASGGAAQAVSPATLMARSVSLSGADVVNGIREPAEMRERARAVLEGLREGWLSVKIHAVLPLAQAGEAHRMLQDRQVTGKILLQTGDVQSG